MPETLSQESAIGDIMHRWTIQEYESHDRGTLWHILMITLGIILIVYALFTGNFLFALIVILFAIVMFLQSNQEALQVNFAITDCGVVVGRRFYAYTEFENFYVIYNPPEVKTLFFETKSIFRPLIRIPLLDEDPVQVRDDLSQFMEEDLEKEDEPLSDRVARRWKIH
ncbi:MAG: hypothetical protein COX81_03515 [Candidatus Magasanikbacteria bacterium CG_4_10_14_0_2_um_filter_37_12]|uniref:DUF5673 domain-containing protein n=1 Tax=Candidatus Magasanikbacteria bacterium CG_4_10_14_0_2_um_filter_37_12 TaxID=1974637 RepID=A0A2M7V6Z9_9BACT|nr:MAG: hypothetical protein COX81_03515 [Candidatus Magasanikbacteria bacterium CG_4_10_14_0_2_um_filter_37_12]